MTEFQKEIDLLTKSKRPYSVNYGDDIICLFQDGYVYTYDWKTEKFIDKKPQENV